MTKQRHDTVKDIGIDSARGVVSTEIHDTSSEVAAFERAPTVEAPISYQDLIQEASRED